MKYDQFGGHRVIEPKGFLPQAATKVDNNPEIYPNEILIDVIALQPTSSAFSEISNECGGDIARIKERFIEIISTQGKFQEPKTKSGGILIGTIEKIGEELNVDAKVGDKIATLVSLSLTPLKVNEIKDIDMNTDQVFVDGKAILFETGIFTKLPEDLPTNVSLAAMDVAGAPAMVAMNAKPGDVVVVVGAGKAGLLSLAVAKEKVAPFGKVVCLEYSKERCKVVEDLGLADIALSVDAQKPLKTYEDYMKTVGIEADFTVNTVNVPDTELSTILVTKNTGKIYFFSMSTNFVKASLGAEGVKKYTQMIVGDGYYPGHDLITFDILRRNDKLRKFFEEFFG